MQAETEIGRGEDGERFDEDVGGGFVPGEVRVELIAVLGTNGKEGRVSRIFLPVAEGEREEGFRRSRIR